MHLFAKTEYFSFNFVTFLNITVDNATETGGRSTAVEVGLWVKYVCTE